MILLSTQHSALSTRHEIGWAAGMTAAAFGLAAALLYDFWSPEVFLAGHDTFTHDYLMWDWGWRAFFEHWRVPLWNPYLFGGWPFIASFAFCPFYPPAWLSAPLPTALALTSQYGLHFAVGAVGFYALCRAMRVSAPVALAMALLYEVGAHVTTLAYPGHLAKVQAIAWLCWALAAAVMLARRPGVWWGVGLGAAWALQLLASHAQIFYTTFWITTLYVVGFVLFHGRPVRQSAGSPVGQSDRSDRSDRSDQSDQSDQSSVLSPQSSALSTQHSVLSPQSSVLSSQSSALSTQHSALKPLAGLVLAFVVALGLSAVQMLPSLEMSATSNRGAGVDYKTASFGGLPCVELAEVFLPCFRGDSTGKLQVRGSDGRTAALPYLGKWHANEKGEGAERIVSDYAGVWVVVLAVYGLLLSPGRKRWFFASAAAAAALVSVGDATPAFRWAYRVAPGFSHFRSPATFMIGVHIGVFALAALGAQALLQRARDWNAGALLRACWRAWVLAVVFLLFAWWSGRTVSGLISLLEAGGSREESLRLKGWILALRAGRHVLISLASGLGVLALCALSRLWSLKSDFCVPKAILCFLLALWVGVGILDPALHIRHFFPTDRTQNLERYLRENPVEALILRDAKAAGLPTVIESGRELSNRPMMRGVRSLHGYHPVVYGDYEKLLAATGFFLSPVTWRHFAMNYLVLGETEAMPDPQNSTLSTQHSALSTLPSGWRTLAVFQGRRVLARDVPIPVARVPRRIVAIHQKWRDLSAEEWRARIGGAKSDPARQTFCEDEYEWAVPTPSLKDSSTTKALEVSARMLGPREWELRWAEQGPSADKIRSALAGRDGLIPCLLAVPAGPGWRAGIKSARNAKADSPNREDLGREWPRRANGFFLLAPMPSSSQKCTLLDYSPLSFPIGAIISLLTVLLISIAAAFRLVIAVRSRRAGIRGKSSLSG